MPVCHVTRSGEEQSEGEEPEEAENSHELRNVAVDETEESEESEESDSENYKNDEDNRIECCCFTCEGCKNVHRLHFSELKNQIWIKKDFSYLHGKRITRARPLSHDFIGREVKILILLAHKFCPESPWYKLPEETMKHIFKFAPERGNDLFLELDGNIPFLIGYRKREAEFFEDASGATYLDVVVYRIPKKVIVQTEEVAFIFVMSFLCAVICGLLTVIIVELV